MAHWKTSIAMVCSAATVGSLSTCDTDVLDNPSFDLWCGDELCGWEVTEGAIAKVSTWHERDYGVAMVGQEVILTQLSAATSGGLECLTFELIADAPGGADLALQLDFNDDGHVDYEQPIPAESWQFTRFNVTPPTWFQSLRINLAKYGEDEAVLAQVRAISDEAANCEAPPIELDERPNGASCESDSQCWADVCLAVAWLDPYPVDNEWHALTWDRCGECATSADCEDGQACGLEATAVSVDTFSECGASGRHALGEHCFTPEECGSGICNDGQCAECGDDAPCAAGTCARGTPEKSSVPMPFQCTPANQLRAKGEPCLLDADCTSGACASAESLRLCLPDGRRCSGDDDCPYGSCFSLGAYDGTCQ
jgi:hypothetical protein